MLDGPEHPDVDAAVAFSGSVLGWDFADTGEDYGGYRIATVRDAAVAGIGPQMSDAPPAWTLYLASDDADATAAAVTGHGGTLLLPRGTSGRWAGWRSPRTPRALSSASGRQAR